MMITSLSVLDDNTSEERLRKKRLADEISRRVNFHMDNNFDDEGGSLLTPDLNL